MQLGTTSQKSGLPSWYEVSTVAAELGMCHVDYLVQNLVLR